MSRGRRVTFLGLLLLIAAEAHAQQTSKVHQVGYLIYGSPASVAPRMEALRMGLRDLGYVEGKNIILVFRSAETADRLPEAAADLVINLRTAKALGLTIPPSVLARADEVIE